MSAKKRAKEFQQEMMESAHKIWLAGLGAMAIAEQEGSKLFKNLVEKGETVETRGREQVDKAMGTFSGVKTVAESYWETLERTMDDQLTTVIHRLGVPTKGEIEKLTSKVEALTRSVEKLRTKDAAARAATAKPKRAASKPTSKPSTKK